MLTEIKKMFQQLFEFITKNMKTNPKISIAIVISIILLFALIYYKNKFHKYNTKVKEALSGIDISLEKKYQILKNVLNSSKSYFKHEKEILMNFVNNYKAPVNLNTEEKQQLNQELNNKLSNVCNILSNVKSPVLQSSPVVINLQKNITKVEEDLQAARRIYNSNVTIYNNSLSNLPGSLFNALFSYPQALFFQKDANVEFNIKNLDFNF